MLLFIPSYQDLTNMLLQKKKNRYLIIIDDIWDTTDWTYIQSAFLDLENNCGSRIITTTRVHSVAKSCCSDIDGTIYALKPLSRDDSKQLFYKRVFGSEGSCHSELKETSEKILKKCGGVPLAIIHIASLLANKPRNISEWNNVLNSIGSGLEEGMEDMRQILSISYNALPPKLKPCLLYLSIFPEDYSIPTDQLVRRWISEGFVHRQQHDTVSLLELGFSYFCELINRSMIQPEHLNNCCRVHDMVLDLIRSLSTEENFVTTFDGYQHADHPEKVRRLSLQNNEEGHNLTHAKSNLSHLRSVVVFPGATNLMPPVSNLPVLRVLDVEHCRDLENHHIAGVGKLFHLRYLGLRDTNITKLPRELGNLHCLHTLDLSQTSITELPSTVVRLKQLVRLYIEDSVKLPMGIGRLKLLQVLSSISVSSSPDIVGELGNLTELRVLHISLISGTGTWCKSYEKPLLDSMFKLQKIQELYIRSFGVPTDFIADFGWFPQHLKVLGSSISKLPSWMNSSLSNLYTINMSLHILRQEDIQNLGLIPFLRYLYLNTGEIESTEERLVIGTDSSQFQCLYHLSFDSLYAMGVMFVQGALPNLKSLDIMIRARETKDLYGDFNIGLENLYSVRKVSVKIGCTGCRRSEVESAEAEIRRAIVNNPNNPMFDMTRCFEYELDEVQHQASEETIEEEEQVPVINQLVLSTMHALTINYPTFVNLIAFSLS